MVRSIVLVSAMLFVGQGLQAVTVPAKSRPQQNGVKKNRLLQIPVEWDITRSRFRSVATTTESYRELWTLTVDEDGRSFLASPRARIAVFGAAAFTENGRLPKHLIMNESDFAKLVGVGSSAASGERDVTDRLISIRVQTRGGQAERLVLQAESEADDLYQVNLKIGKL